MTWKKGRWRKEEIYQKIPITEAEQRQQRQQRQQIQHATDFKGFMEDHQPSPKAALSSSTINALICEDKESREASTSTRLGEWNSSEHDCSFLEFSASVETLNTKGMFGGGRFRAAGGGCERRRGRGISNRETLTEYSAKVSTWREEREEGRERNGNVTVKEHRRTDDGTTTADNMRMEEMGEFRRKERKRRNIIKHRPWKSNRNQASIYEESLPLVSMRLI